MGKALSTVGRISAPGRRFSASRRLHSGNRRAIARHNYQVGEVLHAFNTAQTNLFLVFWRLAGNTDIDLSLDLWESQPSDLGQRKLLEIYVRRVVRRKSIQNALLWTIAAMNELAEKRNDAVHADVLWYYDKVIPGLGTKRSRRARLEEVPLSTIWHDLRGDLSAVANYVHNLQFDIAFDNAWPSTKRPKLKLVRSTSARRQSQLRQAKREGRERQRQSSRD